MTRGSRPISRSTRTLAVALGVTLAVAAALVLTVATSEPSPPPPAPPPAPVRHLYTLKVTGTIGGATIDYGVPRSSFSSLEHAPMPWTATIQSDHDRPMLSAWTRIGSGEAGTLACTVTDDAGRVVASDQASSAGGADGFASVNCQQP